MCLELNVGGSLVTFSAACERWVRRKLYSYCLYSKYLDVMRCLCPSFTASRVYWVQLLNTRVLVSCATTATNEVVLQSLRPLRSFIAFYSDRTKRNFSFAHELNFLLVCLFLFIFPNKLILTIISLLQKWWAVRLSVSGENSQQVKQWDSGVCVCILYVSNSCRSCRV